MDWSYPHVKLEQFVLRCSNCKKVICIGIVIRRFSNLFVRVVCHGAAHETADGVYLFVL